MDDLPDWLILPESGVWVAELVRAEMADAANRAVGAGAGTPLEFVGAGAVAIVFRSGNVAYKTGRRRSPTVFGLLHEEHAWLESAFGVDPEHVVRPLSFDEEQIVIVREYVEGGPGRWSDANRLRAWWDVMAVRMRELDWGMPEFKEDSFVRTAEGFVLVDGNWTNRLCNRFADFLEGWLVGEQHPWAVGSLSPRDLGFSLRMEAQSGCVDPERAEVLLQRLEELEQR